VLLTSLPGHTCIPATVDFIPNSGVHLLEAQQQKRNHSGQSHGIQQWRASQDDK
jgi:hypothetical protein